MGKSRKYTDEEFIIAVQTSLSFRQALKKLGLRPTGGNYKIMKSRIRRIGLDTSHMTGKGHLKYKTHNWAKKIPTINILVEDSDYPTSKLKSRLLKEGLFEHKCYECGIREWRGSPVPIELEHKNGNSRDHRIENLTILCLHCHAMTSTWRGRNKLKKTIWGRGEIGETPQT